MLHGAIERHAAPPAPQKLCFFFNAQLHHVYHAMPLAVEMARDRRFAVDIVALTHEHLALARDIAARHGAMNMRFVLIEGKGLSALTRLVGGATPPKLAGLLAARRQLSAYDAIVVPERTSLLLRHAGLRRTCFIHTCHGAGDRAVGYDRRIRHFDFVLLAGEKQRRRMLERALIREGHYAVVGYGKFDLTCDRPPLPLFAQERPVVLYNPHFSRKLSSWGEMGLDVIRQFARDDRFNLIVAPHIRMYDDRRRRERAERELAEFAALPHIHVDLGSAASVDMSYTRMASLYLGDVSSQIYEFVVKPRPCLFLDAHGASWQDNPNYRHWQYGPVHDNCEGITDKVALAMETHAAYLGAQRQGVADTFDCEARGSSERAGRAVADFLTYRAGQRDVTRLMPANRTSGPFARGGKLIHE
ncbi:glycosyl transferase [Novosphingobium resinovorum]|uniref:glycosyl transferase n=1 Tax=Novosphingobium resinovorum TaxID=158500 RepID=UPI002ED61500|nr:glycosyl transferase [Novosphingobium resinovorum]